MITERLDECYVAGQAVARDLLESGYRYIESEVPYGNYIAKPGELITEETPAVIDFIHGVGYFAKQGFFGDHPEVDLYIFTDTVVDTLKIEQAEKVAA